MLELKGITKVYPTGGENVTALKGIDLKFRENEFVSILGPSGCGKTTMLNIIGGLDQYTDGDLIINGISTKEFKDRDWDTYRNHSIGFVFQSYNLIPHQTVLQNVELALTLSGVGKNERRKKAIEALEKVGLGDQLKKRPNEMSGGQMQRVAIARAIVNNPDIILADEPTGALDTTTSVQVMDILRDIAKDKLVIMVTHNPELAEQYSTRIVRMLDGNVMGDSNPVDDSELLSIKDDTHTTKAKPSMSFGTSFGLSLNNLLTKKGRTILTSFAGSIGIIGIALIFAISHGMTTYINNVQEETLTAYPITIEAQSIDISSLLTTFMGKAESTSEHENDAIYQKAMFYDMMNAMSSTKTQENDLQSFKEYVEKECADENSELHNAISSIQYSYSPELLIYTKNVDDEIIRCDTQTLMTDLMSESSGVDMSAMVEYRNSMMSSASSIMTSSTSMWKEILTGAEGELISPVVEKQNELLYGRWPESYNELVLFVDENNEVDDVTLYAMGLKSGDEMSSLLDSAKNHEDVKLDDSSWSYEDICNTEFRTILNSSCYTKDEITGLYTDLRSTSSGLKYLYDNGVSLKVVGIVKPSENAVSANTNSYIGYTRELTEYVINEAYNCDAAKAQIADEKTDIFTGLPFEDTDGKMSDSEKSEAFIERVNTFDDEQKANTYIGIMSIPADSLVEETVNKTMEGMTREQIEQSMEQSMQSQMSLDADTLKTYISKMDDDELNSLISQMVEEQFRKQYAAKIKAQFSMIPANGLAKMLDNALDTYTVEECAKYYDEVLEFSTSSYKDNLIKLGCADLNNPSVINLYASSFENKDVIADAISAYNETVDDLQEIQYTDYVGLMMSSITTIINAITYVLIAFVAISLIVSSIMIGVITLISVQERTKEIGILRAIGASKKNVSGMFNAETVIIGFTSGALGVIITYLLTIPINIILHNMTGISNLNAILPLSVALILVAISMILTLIAGIIPSRSAAKKDPVVALRTE